MARGLLGQRVIITALESPFSAADQKDLAALLRACVEGGASIGFVLPLVEAEIEAYWNKIGRELQGGHRILLAARTREGGSILGVAQLAREIRANGRHRAEAQKVMVLPAERRRGIAAALMLRLEAEARACGVTLLCLDTSEGPGGARAFYDALGYAYVGGIPGYALDPDGTPMKNAIYYKTLAPAE